MTIKDLYAPFRGMVRKWQYLKMAQYAGVGHTKDGINKIKPGDLALPCPACPRPGVNLPVGWETADESVR